MDVFVLKYYIRHMDDVKKINHFIHIVVILNL